jgi:ubiquinone/menaquinone biosynthesis C-methylase UbiE
MTTEKGYRPALRFRWLTRFYDPVANLTLNEKRTKGRLVEQVGLKPGHRVLDIGCGTGTLALLLKTAQPQAEVVGLDGDPEILEIARRKTAEGGLVIEFREGMADVPHFEPGHFDRIVSSLVLHHLTTDKKRDTLAQARRALRSGGEIHIADWGKAQNPLMRIAFLGVQLLDGFETTNDNVRGLLPDLMRSAGFEEVEETHHEMTMFGTLSLYRGAAGWASRAVACRSDPDTTEEIIRAMSASNTSSSLEKA